MSNTYFKFDKSERKGNSTSDFDFDSSISLTAFCGAAPNMIQLTLTTTNHGKSECGYILLTESEQDRLIAGILERRDRISATGCEKSKICPNDA